MSASATLPQGLDAHFGRAVAALRGLEVATGPNAIAAWALLLEERESLSIGVKDKQIGGVYAPPQVTRELSGDLYVLWKERVDGQAAVSKTRVDALWLSDVPASLRALRARAYPEKFVPDLPESRPVPEVAVHDPAVVALVREDPGYAFELLSEIKPRLRHVKTSFTGGVGAGITRRRIANSKGLDAEVRSTMASFSAEGDSLHGVGTQDRRLLDRRVVTDRLDRLDAWLPHFEKAEPGASERLPVVLLPDAAASFLGHFVLGNLDGEAIANGQSAWGAADFEAKKSVFAESLTLGFDPLEDWKPWSYRLDRRGLPAERRAYIERGRLVTPIVSLKAAKQLNCAPTPSPSASGLTIGAAGSVDLDRHVASLDRAVVVPGVLGMHTQDAARGGYSLSVPHALLVRGGKIVGAAKAVLSGNFFEDLSGPVSAVASPADDSPGLALAAGVRFG